ncbi:Arsenate reductase [Enhygromyxa salina]|uniref:Arsenate reductase n=1 Tax=Enhygromyxa salina TaxID=215803 RepID=A0A0C2D3R4_9BACT|nr:hypothetical protein [Enhygromyxa salina]KIG16370.1 Arsenate reductase [Enhygromyxa salina]
MTTDRSDLLLHPQLRAYVEARVPELAAITAARRQSLDTLAQFIATEQAAGEPVRLIFICTHNSRRSHISQLWAAAAAAWYGLEVATYSGGTEATAFNPRAVAAMRRAGFEIDDPGGDNPRYTVSFSPGGPKISAFSKIWTHAANPQTGFAAIMTCDSADAACPLVLGSRARISLPYRDPKADDGSPREASSYDASVRLIATEMLYVFERAVRQ